MAQVSPSLSAGRDFFFPLPNLDPGEIFFSHSCVDLIKLFFASSSKLLTNKLDSSSLASLSNLVYLWGQDRVEQSIVPHPINYAHGVGHK